MWHHHERRAVALAEIVEHLDLRAILARDSPLLPLEARAALRIRAELRAKDLDSDRSIASGRRWVASLVAFVHAAGADHGFYLVRTGAGAGGEGRESLRHTWRATDERRDCIVLRSGANWSGSR